MIQRQRAVAPAPRRSRTAGVRMLAVLAGCMCALPVSANCTVTTSGVAFGSYDTFSTQSLQGAGSISVACSPAMAYTIALSAGSGSYATRTLLSGSDTLGYNLFTDSTLTTVWGDGGGGTATVVGSGESALHTVYGRIPARQNVRAGSYADSIVVTLTF